MSTNYTTIHVINDYYKYMYPHLVLPDDIDSDQDTIFTSLQWLHSCRTQHISQSISTPYHSQTDGHTDVANRHILAIL